MQWRESYAPGVATRLRDVSTLIWHEVTRVPQFRLTFGMHVQPGEEGKWG